MLFTDVSSGSIQTQKEESLLHTEGKQVTLFGGFFLGACLYWKVTCFVV